MSIIKLIATVSLAVALITMVTSNQLSIYATPTSEDDGWVEGLEEQEEQAQEDWEDAGRPGEIEDENDDDENNNDSEELVECEDGSLVDTEELCEQSEALVLCSDGSYAETLDECPPEPVSSFVTCSDGSSAATQAECPPEPEPVSSFVTCSDGSSAATQAECPPESDGVPDGAIEYPDGVIEYPDGVIEYPDGVIEYPDGVIEYPDGVIEYPDGVIEYPASCPDVPFYMTCPDDPKTKDSDNDKPKVIQKTTVIERDSASATATATVNTAEISNCRLDGSVHGIQQKFDSIKYRACGLYPNGQIAYTDGFVVGCTQAGNTQQLCQAFVIMNTQQTQTKTTQSTTQPTQPTQTQPLTHSRHAIQPSAVN
jgi:hypothetical protein